jgi:hypothetical protein
MLVFELYNNDSRNSNHGLFCELADVFEYIYERHIANFYILAYNDTAMFCVYAKNGTFVIDHTQLLNEIHNWFEEGF